MVSVYVGLWVDGLQASQTPVRAVLLSLAQNWSSTSPSANLLDGCIHIASDPAEARVGSMTGGRSDLALCRLAGTFLCSKTSNGYWSYKRATTNCTIFVPQPAKISFGFAVVPLVYGNSVN